MSGHGGVSTQEVGREGGGGREGDERGELGEREGDVRDSHAQLGQRRGRLGGAHAVNHRLIIRFFLVYLLSSYSKYKEKR